MDLFFTSKNEQALNLVLSQIMTKYGVSRTEIPMDLLKEAMVATYNRGPGQITSEEALLFINQEVVKGLEQYFHYQRRSVTVEKEKEIERPPSPSSSIQLYEQALVLRADPILECWSVQFEHPLSLYTVKYLCGRPRLVFPLLTGDQPVQINGKMEHFHGQPIYSIDELCDMFQLAFKDHDIQVKGNDRLTMTRKSASKYMSDLKVDFNPTMQGLFRTEGIILGPMPVTLYVPHRKPDLLSLQMVFEGDKMQQVTCHRMTDTLYATQGFSLSSRITSGSLSVRLVDPFDSTMVYFNDAIDLGLVVEFAQQDNI